MDNKDAKKVLGLEKDFTQVDLLETYKKDVEQLYQNMESADAEDKVTRLANDIYDKSNAYLALRETPIPFEPLHNQPLIVFTDASYRKDKEISSFGIVIENIYHDFDIF